MSTASIVSNVRTSEDKSSTIRQLVVFQLAGGSFGVDIQFVREINRLTEITPIPTAAHFVEGIMNLRGTVVPVVSLGLRLGLAKSETTKDTRIVVIESSGNILGLIVDQVSEVLRLNDSDVEPANGMATGGVNVDFIDGVGKIGERLILLLSPDKLFSKEEHADFAAIK